LSHIYLGAVAFGVTLLVASLLLGGKDVHAGAGHGGHDTASGFGWVPIGSLRFWVFMLAFGGITGWVLLEVGESETIAAVGSVGIGWVSGTLAVAIIRSLTRRSVSSEVTASELVGMTGQLLLPAGPGKPGKVRIEIKGRTEDFVASVVDDGVELPTGASVLVVAEGERGSLLVAKAEV